MSTWNTITIENPGALSPENLPEALTDSGEIWEGYSADMVADRLVISGRSKWTPDAAVDAIIEASKTTGPITHYMEFEYDEVGQEEHRYENGERVGGSVSQLVPDNLMDLIKAVRKHVRRDRHGDIQTELHGDSMEAVMALVDALDPEGAQS